MRNNREDREGYQTSQSKHTRQNVVTILDYANAHAQRAEWAKMATEKAGDHHFICQRDYCKLFKSLAFGKQCQWTSNTRYLQRLRGNRHTHTHKPITITLRLRVRVNKKLFEPMLHHMMLSQTLMYIYLVSPYFLVLLKIVFEVLMRIPDFLQCINVSISVDCQFVQHNLLTTLILRFSWMYMFVSFFYIFTCRTDQERRVEAAKMAITSLLKSWSGELYVQYLY